MNYKIILKSLLVAGLLLFSLPNVFSEDSIFSDTGELPYCDNNECGYQSGVKKVQGLIENAETSKPLSEYIQDIIVYLLTFISIIAVIYVIYAGFRILIGGGSDDSIKNSRKTILHVVIGIIIIWLAYSIVALILDVLGTAQDLGD